jgi:hypothetical protein
MPGVRPGSDPPENTCLRKLPGRQS